MPCSHRFQLIHLPTQISIMPQVLCLPACLGRYLQGPTDDGSIRYWTSNCVGLAGASMSGFLPGGREMNGLRVEI